MLASSDSSVWAAGLRRTGSRELSDAECAELAARIRGFRLRGLWALGGIPVLAGALATLLLLWGDRPVQGVVAVPVIVLTVLTPLLVLTARDCLGLARALARDGRSGRAERFEGVPAPLEGVDPALRRMLQSGLLQRDATQPQWFEVLPASGLVWRANGLRPAQWIRASLAITANLPTYAAIAAEWVESVDAAREDAFHLGRRNLSEAEAQEIRRHQIRLTARPGITAGLLTLWLAFSLWAWYASAYDMREPHRVVLLAVLAALTVQALWSLGRSAWLAYRFQLDLRTRTAIIVRAPSLLPRQDQGPNALMPADEFLAVSGVLWTRNGLPAHWRLLPAR